jgi:glycerophosphoryl diester phosphodiesterase
MLGVQIWHYRFLAEPVEKPIVCAHRGDNTHAPENTEPAFELALVENTPMIECDVIQTKDGVVVCSHDYNLKRVTGRNLEISKSTFEEVEQLTMLPTMPGNYENVKVPTLEEVLTSTEFFDAMIQIELKPTPNDTNLEEEVVRLIHKHNMKDKCYVISLYYEPLLKVKELDPEIKTGVATIAAWDNYTEVEGLDVLSIADSGINPDLVRAMHEKGYRVMVWTVDDIDAVQYLVSCGVDVIGTNDPTAIQEGVDLADASGGASRIFHVLMHMFKGTEDSSLMKGKAS